MKYLNKITVLLLIGICITACDLQKNNARQDINKKLLNLFESSSLDENVLMIYDIDQSKITHEIQDGWENGWTENKAALQALGPEVCRGTGISFARCVRDEVDKGNCVKVYKDGDEYVAEQMPCRN